MDVYHRGNRVIVQDELRLGFKFTHDENAEEPVVESLNDFDYKKKMDYNDPPTDKVLKEL